MVVQVGQHDVMGSLARVDRPAPQERLSDWEREFVEPRLDQWLPAQRGLDARPDEPIDPDRFVDLFPHGSRLRPD